ncbi:colicin transporter [Bifidobacterium saguini]|uniref:Colicin transporter n=1 Tax=Bifidobacterium saguini TaxID=762210 RepID=A0ABX7SE61_9BIFI|nr:colicin transporter [Bifidobacterium saguini]QTB90700.1 colicin transporter [Bifidobacterium saguini]
MSGRDENMNEKENENVMSESENDMNESENENGAVSMPVPAAGADGVGGSSVAASADASAEARRRPGWLAPVVAAVCVAALAAGGVAAWRAYAAHGLAVARQSCADSAEKVRGAANSYNALVNGKAGEASSTGRDEVADPATVEALAKELKAEAPEYEGCVADDKAGLDEAAGTLDDQAAWYESHEKSLAKAVKAVNASKAEKTLETARTNLSSKLDEASKLLAGSDGKVADNAARDTLAKAIDAANGLKNGNDAARIDEARKTLEDAMKTVGDSIAAKQEADARAAAEAAAAAAAQQAQAGRSNTSQGSRSQYTYSNTGNRGTGSTGSNAGTGSGSTGSTTRPNLNGGHGCGNSCTGVDDGYYHH